MIRFTHSADWHFRRSKAQDVFASMDVMERGLDGIDFQIVAGDIWDSPVQNTGASQFPEFIARVSRMAEKAPMVMVQGTPSHDADGSLDIFDQDPNITVLRPGKAYFFHKSRMGNAKVVDEGGPGDALILGVPEPQPKWLLANDANITLDQAMQRLFLGYAAIRQKYADIPCILVYHGQVRGARMGHGQTADHGVSIDDLAIVGADYIAMGDIHIPQRVGESRGLHAYYPGAIHPTGDWKDADYQFGYNVVTIGRMESAARNQGDLFSDSVAVVAKEPCIERVDLPHPVLTKIETKAGDNIPSSLVQPGSRVWWEISGSKQDHAIIDLTTPLHDLMAHGAAPFSKVTFKTVTSETVRSELITTKRRLSEKARVWMESSKLNMTPSMVEKFEAIEVEASGKGVIMNGGHFLFQKVILRGAKGIWKNQRKDEVTFSLDSIREGVVGFVGPNGRGKTTILNNFHPWPEMPNFPGDPLYRHFRLKDSFREFYATDVASKTEYKSLMKINAASETVGYFLFQRPMGSSLDWAPVPGIDGRLAAYEAEVNRIFGTLDLYLRTGFLMQTPTDKTPDLSRATKGNKKAIMSALAGIDFYDTYKALAAAHAKESEAKAVTAKTKISALSDVLPSKEEVEEKIKAAHVDIRENAKTIEDLEVRGKALGEEVKALELRQASQQVIINQVADCGGELFRVELDINNAEQEIQSLRSTIEGRADTAATIARYDALVVKEKTLMADRERVLAGFNAELAAHAQKVAQLNAEIATHEEGIRAVNQDLSNAMHEHQNKAMQDRAKWSSMVEDWEKLSREKRARSSDLANELIRLEREIAERETVLSHPVDDTCPTCRQILPADKIQDAAAAREAIRQEVKTLQGALGDLQERIQAEIAIDLPQRPVEPVQEAFDRSGYDAKIKALRDQIDAIQFGMPDAPKLPEEPADLKEVRSSLSAINIDVERAKLARSESAAGRIADKEKDIEAMKARMKEIAQKSNDLKAQIDNSLSIILSAKAQDLENLRSDYRAATSQKASIEAVIQHALEDLVKIKAMEDQISEYRRIAGEETRQHAEWDLVAKACGKDGIQALELDAVCPTVAKVTSKLLEEYEEGRYSIRFDTTRDGSKGNQIEDFLIMVIDSQDGNEQELYTLSGGEGVWVRKALQDAFGIIRGQNSGIKYLTGILDEADGALHADSRVSYYRMIGNAHSQSLRTHTVVVTHSPEIQDMLDQRIEVTEL